MKLSRRRLFAGLTTLAAAAGGAGFTLRSAQARYYNGPVSDHFDGRRFFDPHGAPPKSFVDLARWLIRKKWNAWPDHVPLAQTDRPPARVEDRAWRISYVGHATLLIQTAGLNILTDPVWSERASPFAFIGPNWQSQGKFKVGEDKLSLEWTSVDGAAVKPRRNHAIA